MKTRFDRFLKSLTMH